MGRVNNGEAGPFVMHPITDTGYTKICPECSSRYAPDPKLIGKERALEIVLCEACSKLTTNRNHWTKKI